MLRWVADWVFVWFFLVVQWALFGLLILGMMWIHQIGPFRKRKK